MNGEDRDGNRNGICLVRVRVESGLDLPERPASLSNNGELRVLVVLDGYRRRGCGLGKWVCCGLPCAGM